MVPALLLPFLAQASAGDLSVTVRAPDGDAGTVTLALLPDSPLPPMLPLALTPPPDSRRRKSPYTVEAGLEQMGSTIAVTCRVYDGAGEKRELLVESQLLVAPGADASLRVPWKNPGEEWACDVRHADRSDLVIPPPPPASPAATPR
jgi:hypothetical protein